MAHIYFTKHPLPKNTRKPKKKKKKDSMFDTKKIRKVKRTKTKIFQKRRKSLTY